VQFSRMCIDTDSTFLLTVILHTDDWSTDFIKRAAFYTHSDI